MNNYSAIQILMNHTQDLKLNDKIRYPEKYNLSDQEVFHLQDIKRAINAAIQSLNQDPMGSFDGYWLTDVSTSAVRFRCSVCGYITHQIKDTCPFCNSQMKYNLR